MTIKNNNKKENNIEPEVKIIGETSSNEEVLKFEQALKEEKLKFTRNASSGDQAKKAGEKISLALVFALLILSIIQSVELFNLQSQIAKGQFGAGAAASFQGAVQGLPSQQGGC